MTLLLQSLLCLLLLSSLCQAQKVIPHEPMSVVKSFLPKPSEEQLLLWKPLLTKSSGSDREKLIKQINEHTKHLINSKAFVLSLNGVLFYEHFPSEMKWNTSHVIPYPNLVTFITTSLSILLEGFEPDVLFKPLKELVKGTDLIIPRLYQSSNLIELLSTTPEGFELETKHFLVSYETQAYVVVRVINTLLGGSLNDAWHDACMSLQLDNSALNNDNEKKLHSPFSDIYRFTEVVHSDLTSLPAHALDEVSYPRSEHYVFGWWVNGGDVGQRLLDVLPADALISFSPTMQIFVIPSLKLSAVMVNDVATSWNEKTVGEILREDNEIWRQVLMVSNSAYHDEYTKKKEEEEKKREEARKRDEEGKRKKEETLRESEEFKKEKESEKGKESEQSSEQDKDEKSLKDIIGDYFTALEGLVPVLSVILAPIKAILYVVFLYLDFAASQHMVVRIFLFIGFIVVGHAVVSGIFHTIWFFLTLISSRTYQQRPKMPGKDD